MNIYLLYALCNKLFLPIAYSLRPKDSKLRLLS